MEQPNLLLPDAVSPKANCNMFVAIVIAMLGAIMFGLDQGNYGNVQAFASFQDDWCVGVFNFSKAECRAATGNNASEAIQNGWTNAFVLWGGCLITFGAAFGALLLGPVISTRCGRRACISLGGLVCCFGCILATYLSYQNVGVFMLGRFVTGFGVGVCCFSLPIYNGEISTPQYRGMCGSLFQFMVVIGSFLATVITMFCKDWKIGMMLPGFAGFAVTFLAWLVPESPRWLMAKKGYEAGVAALRRVRSGDVTAEAREMMASIEAQANVQSVSYKGLLIGDPNLRRRFLVVVGMQVAQQMSGVNAFLSYAGTLFGNIGMSDPVTFNVIWNAIMVFGCVVGLVMVDSRCGGRRIQLIVATVLMMLPMACGGIGIAFNINVMSIVCVCLYGWGFQFGWGIIPWLYPGEVFSLREKDKAVSIAVGFEYIFNAVIVIITPPMITWSVPGTLWLYAGFNFLNFIFVVLCVKETKGVAMDKVPALFERKDRAVEVEAIP